MAEIDPSEPWKLISKPIMLTKPEYSWELVNNRVNEGAAVLKTDKKVYVFFSASGTGSEYCVGRMEADINSDLMNINSWKKLSSPVLQTADLSGQSGLLCKRRKGKSSYCLSRPSLITLGSEVRHL